MWKNIILIITVVLAAVAVWLLIDMRGSDTRQQFINCKVENIQLTIQYGRCLEALNETRAQSTDTNDESNTAQDPEVGGMITDPDPGGMIPGPGLTALDPDVGGMITDPDPGGMITDSNPGIVLFAPSRAKLNKCGERNTEFRTALKTCADELEKGVDPGGR